ncbi:hypothetical protein Ahy_A01g000936 [Arachis hypogaea]|uniref:Uncharacterized protein n=1 Tax=Arachis hypogaea TaxID=3818 RepID=A0A445ELL9_ARAHY|nr:hypothetical protein Ahy_A01g000936 [Arachis hypogaea]
MAISLRIFNSVSCSNASNSKKKERKFDGKCLCALEVALIESSTLDGYRARVAVTNRQRRALLRRRLFGRAGLVSTDVVAQRKLQWCVRYVNNNSIECIRRLVDMIWEFGFFSIYNQRLQPNYATLRCLERGCKGCGPFATMICNQSSYFYLNPQHESFNLRDILQRIEPWINEGATSSLRGLRSNCHCSCDHLTIHHLARREGEISPSWHLHVGDTFISPLRPFLQDKATIFWHELRVRPRDAQGGVMILVLVNQSR